MRVLVVDDDADVRLWLRTTLEFHRYDVVEASSGDEGVILVRDDQTGPFDVVILDQMMPEMTGLEAAASMRPDFDRPVVLFSAYLSAELHDEARRLQVTPISKLDQDALLRLLAGVAAASVTPSSSS